MFESEFFKGTILLSIIGSALYGLKTLIPIIRDQLSKKFVYSVKIFQTDRLYHFFEEWMRENHGHSFRRLEATVETEYENSDGNQISCDYEDYGDSRFITKFKLALKQIEDFIIIKHKGKRILISQGREKMEHATDIRSLYFNQYNLVSFFSGDAIQEILQEVVAKQTEKIMAAKKIELYHNNKHGWRFADAIEGRHPDTVYLPQDTREQIFSAIDNFNKSKDWYRKRGIPYKLTILIDGPPGNGKTSLIQAICRKYRRSVYYMEMNSKDIDSNLIVELFAELKPDSLLVMEDIDCNFVGKRDMKNDQINFSTLLNCLDGVLTKDGLVTIMTTNIKTDLDEALLRRGRVDVHATINHPQQDVVQQYYRAFFERELSLPEDWDGSKWSMAAIQDIFCTYQDKPEEAAKSIGGSL